MNYHYKTLGLKESASQEEIQNAYELLSKELDPKNNDNQEFFEEEYKKSKRHTKLFTIVLFWQQKKVQKVTKIKL